MGLRALFHKPSTKPIAGIDFLVFKLGLDQFADAMEFGDWLGDDGFSFEKLRDAVKPGAPQRELLLRIVAGCLALPQENGAEPRRLQATDAGEMPVVMLAEAVAIILEENADFFIQTLPKLAQTMARLAQIGGELLSSSSLPAMTAKPSVATP